MEIYTLGSVTRRDRHNWVTSEFNLELGRHYSLSPPREIEESRTKSGLVSRPRPPSLIYFHFTPPCLLEGVDVLPYEILTKVRVGVHCRGRSLGTVTRPVTERFNGCSCYLTT